MISSVNWFATCFSLCVTVLATRSAAWPFSRVRTLCVSHLHASRRGRDQMSVILTGAAFFFRVLLQCETFQPVALLGRCQSNAQIRNGSFRNGHQWSRRRWRRRKRGSSVVRRRNGSTQRRTCLRTGVGRSDSAGSSSAVGRTSHRHPQVATRRVLRLSRTTARSWHGKRSIAAPALVFLFWPSP